jgi:hypothetical protein
MINVHPADLVNLKAQFFLCLLLRAARRSKGARSSRCCRYALRLAFSIEKILSAPKIPGEGYGWAFQPLSFFHVLPCLQESYPVQFRRKYLPLERSFSTVHDRIAHPVVHTVQPFEEDRNGAGYYFRTTNFQVVDAG